MARSRPLPVTVVSFAHALLAHSARALVLLVGAHRSLRHFYLSQDATNGSTRRSDSAAPPMHGPLPHLLAMRVLSGPLRRQFQFHFEGTKATNQLEKVRTPAPCPDVCRRR